MNAIQSSQQIYKIRLDGPLTDAAVRALGGTRRGNVEGETTILVPVRDRAELHSVLQRLEQLGLDLISVMPVPSRTISADRE